MRNSAIEVKLLPSHHHYYLWFLTLTYAMVIVLANWFDPRLINIFGMTTDAGTLIFPLTFLLSDLITEVYGYKYARRAIWCGFLYNAMFVAYGQIIIHLPSPEYATNNAQFDALLSTDMRVILASSISYIISEPLNSILMSKLKLKLQGRLIGIRFISSTIVASGIDSLLFSVIAFYGVINQSNLITLILSMWLIKVAIEILGLPISIRLAEKLKTIERLDIYDDHTDFNLFSLDTHYQTTDNHFNLTNKS